MYVVCQTRTRVASKPWTIVAAGGTTVVVYAGTYTVIETMIGVSAIATGGGSCEIATGIENWGSLATARELLTAWALVALRAVLARIEKDELPLAHQFLVLMLGVWRTV